jgi:hypothetical protein
MTFAATCQFWHVPTCCGHSRFHSAELRNHDSYLRAGIFQGFALLFHAHVSIGRVAFAAEHAQAAPVLQTIIGDDPNKELDAKGAHDELAANRHAQDRPLQYRK